MLRKLLRTRIKPVIFRALSIVQRLGRDPGKSVLLTFDDGPDPQVTPGVLDRLKQYSVRAMFFIVGNRISLAPEVVKRIEAEGHVLGNHTYNHPDHNPWVVPYVREVSRCQESLRGLTGHSPRFFRAPRGAVTLGGILATRFFGMRMIHWSLDSGDWGLKTPREAQNCGEQLLSLIAPGDIVLFHDDNPCVLTILDTLLPGLRDRDFDLGGAVNLL